MDSMFLLSELPDLGHAARMGVKDQSEGCP